MVKPEWGTRRICYKCATRFYDLLNEPPTCPKCGADQTKAPAKHSSSPARKIKAVVTDEDSDEPRILAGDSEEIEEIGLDELEEEELPEDDA